MMMLRKCFYNKSVVVGSVILFIMILIAIFAPALAPHDPYLTDGTMALKGPMEGYPLGTDELGRCVLSRMGMALGSPFLIAFCLWPWPW